MAITQTARFGLNRWGADTDPQDRVDFVEMIDAIETTAKEAQLGLRNRIINGDFRVNQRAYASGAALAVGDYGFDRWKSMVANSSLTFVAAANGQLVTINAGGQFAQVIERANMPAGRYVLSHAGTAKARVYNSGAAAPAFAATPLVVDVDGLADVVVEFQADGGATKTMGKVQLEQVDAAGVVEDATPFEVRPLGLELALCLRYFWRVAGNGTIGVPIATGLWITTTVCRCTLPLPVPMRAQPTVTVSGNSYQVRYGADSSQNAFALSVHGVAGTGPQGPAIGLSITTPLAAGSVGQAGLLESGGSTLGIDVSAEL